MKTVFAPSFLALVAVGSSAQTDYDVIELWLPGEQKSVISVIDHGPSFLIGSTQKISIKTRSLSEKAKTWIPGDTLLVFFYGDRSDWDKKVASYAAEWSTAANIFFDFGMTVDNAAPKKCAPVLEKAVIRVGYDCPNVDWSLVGRESQDSSNKAQCGGERNKSINLGTLQKPNVADREIKRAVLHEFGHALGFLHEFQHPASGCDDELKWDDLISLLRASRPDLSEPDIKKNFSQIKAGSAYMMSGAVDKQSIMQYFIPAGLLKTGVQSPCYSDKNYELSQKDIEATATLYPRNVSRIEFIGARIREAEQVAADISAAQDTDPTLVSGLIGSASKSGRSDSNDPKLEENPELSIRKDELKGLIKHYEELEH